jgi:hypothetical protein
MLQIHTSKIKRNSNPVYLFFTSFDQNVISVASPFEDLTIIPVLNKALLTCSNRLYRRGLDEQQLPLALSAKASLLTLSVASRAPFWAATWLGVLQ